MCMNLIGIFVLLLSILSCRWYLYTMARPWAPKAAKGVGRGSQIKYKQLTRRIPKPEERGHPRQGWPNPDRPVRTRPVHCPSRPCPPPYRPLNPNPPTIPKSFTPFPPTSSTHHFSYSVTVGNWILMCTPISPHFEVSASPSLTSIIHVWRCPPASPQVRGHGT